MNKALVLLNPRAHGGLGKARWESVRPELEKRFLLETVSDLEGVRAAIEGGTRIFIAAGGDGTVNLLLNHLATVKGNVPLDQFTLGAVGLGSSNDFHKPYGEKIGSIPLRLGAPEEKAVGLATFPTPEGEQKRLFVVSAGLGIVAEANGFFNRGDRVVETLKRHWTDGAIVYAALKTLFSYRDQPAVLRDENGERSLSLTNCSVLRTPYLSGFFRYDTPIAESALTLNLCEGMSRSEAFGTLVDLAKGRFQGKKKRSTSQCEALTLCFPHSVTLELDGEIETAQTVTFSLYPERIQVCR